MSSPVTISLFPTSIDLDPIFEKDRDLDRFRFSFQGRPGDIRSHVTVRCQGASDDGMSKVG